MAEAPTIFESFNARSLQPTEVAKTFVPSEAFKQLCGRFHSVVLGPRGSGKTTLLKMLQIPALEAWKHPEAEDTLARIDFIGVFIPFDRSWQAQFEALGQRLSPTTRRAVSRAAFTTHVLRALLSSFISRASKEPAPMREVRRLSLEPKYEQELADLLYRLWMLKPGPRSMKGLRLGLSERLGEIGRLAGRLNHTPQEEQERVVGGLEHLHLNFVDSVSVALDAWEATTNEVQQHWGLLFDELELAPQSVKRELFQSIRSRDSRLLFKLALSPYDGDIHLGESPEDPQAGQDYEEIALWFAEKRGSIPFCEALWRSMLAERRLPIDLPTKRFGHGRFETPTAEWVSTESRTAYGPTSKRTRKFVQLAAVDPSFRRYLDERAIDLSSLHSLPSPARAAEVRKIAPLVEARLFFLREMNATQADVEPEAERRSRKRATLYTGWESICAVTEGNPRLFIGTVRSILAKSTKMHGRIPRSIQADAIERASRRFRAMLRTVPVSDTVARTKNRGLLSVVDALGEFFRVQQIDGRFVSEPPGSFTVDSRYQDDMLRAIGQALNTGALIYVAGSADEDVLSSLRGKRFRLSYLLAAHHGLVPRLGRAVALSHILRDVRFHSRDQLPLELLGLRE